MDNSNRIIHGLWVGDRLSPLELLTLHSFVEHGHEFHLWIYGPLANNLPIGVTCQDANEIIPNSEIFIKQKGDSVNEFGKGSLALFSDLFRYKLLYEKGGWWVDMDVTCLITFDIAETYFFRAHPIIPMIGNVMKCPKQSPLMLVTYEVVKAQCNAKTTDWLLSNKILNENVSNLGLSHFIKSDYSNNDDWIEIERMLYAGQLPKNTWKYIHWMNEVWRSKNISKSAFFINSYLEVLFRKYNLTSESQRASKNMLYKYYMKEMFRSITGLVKRKSLKKL